jgi:hypothetical protein
VLIETIDGIFNPDAQKYLLCLKEFSNSVRWNRRGLRSLARISMWSAVAALQA